jgi:hypothetical protein
MRGVFENSGAALRAGLFARIRLPVGSPYKALLIPDEAVMSDQGRKYVYIVGPEDEVAYRSVTLGQEVKGLRVVKQGLAEGERVVTGGMQRVKAGVRVHADVKPPPKPPGSALGKLLSGRPAAAAAAAPGKEPPAGGPGRPAAAGPAAGGHKPGG